MVNMEAWKIKTFVEFCVSLKISGHLDLDKEEFISFYKECLIVGHYVGDISDTTQSYISFQLGSLYKEIDQFNEALVYYEKAMQIAKTNGDKKAETRALLSIGDLHFLPSMRNLEKTNECYKTALNIAKAVCDKNAEGVANSKLGTLCYLSGNYQEAIAYYEAGLRVALETGDKVTESKAYEILGDLNLKLGKYSEAIEYQTKILNIAKEVGNKSGEGKSYEILGNMYYSLTKYQEAIEYYEKRVAISREVGDKNGEAVGYMKIGNIYLALSKYREAIIYHDMGLNISKQTSNKRAEGQAYANLGNAYLSLGNCQEAISYHEMSLSIFKDIGDERNEATAYTNLGIASKVLGRYNEAAGYYEKGLNIIKDIGDKKGEATAYANLGNVFSSLGKYNKAIEYHEKSLDIAIQIGDKSREGKIYGNLGNAYLLVGKYINAIEYFEMSLKISKEIGDRNGEGISYTNLGNVNLILGKYEEAIGFFEMSIDIAKEIGDKRGEGKDLMNIGNIYYSLGEAQKACEQYEKSLSIAKETGDKSAEGQAYVNLGNVCLSLSKYHEAIQYYEKSLRIMTEIGDKKDEGNCNMNLGRTYTLMSEYDKAIEHYEKSLRVAKEIGDKYNEAQASFSFGRCYHLKSIKDTNVSHDKESLQRLQEQSIHYLKDSLQSWDWIFENLQDQDDFKVSVVDTFVQTYKVLTSVLIESEQAEEALLVSDRGRARALGDLLVSKYGLDKEKTLSSTPLTYSEVEKLLSNDNFCILFFAVGVEDDLHIWVLSHEKPLLFVKKDLTHLIQEQSEDQKDKEHVLDRVINASSEKLNLRQIVKCENRSLEVMEDVHELDTLSRSSVRRDTSPTGILESQSGNQEDYEKAFEILFNLLIAPVFESLEKEEIVIIPEGPFYAVPFAALQHPATGCFLSETKSIRLAPSLSTLKTLQDCRSDLQSKELEGAIVVGDPEVGEVMFKGEKKTFDRLENAMKEAKIVGANLDVEPLTGPQATKDMVKQKLKEGLGVIHIAAHGDAENGHILLAPSTRTESTIPEEQDYMLTMQEVQEIGVKAQLVVLSCCHSGGGEIRSEGVVGISRAFLAAGARAVVASLWAINDEVTLNFMVSFYTYLKQGERASKSLQLAMKEIREEGCDEPKYWAPFFLIGDDVTISAI